MRAVACLRLEKWRWTVSGTIVMPFAAVPYANGRNRNVNSGFKVIMNLEILYVVAYQHVRSLFLLPMPVRYPFAIIIMMANIKHISQKNCNNMSGGE